MIKMRTSLEATTEVSLATTTPFVPGGRKPGAPSTLRAVIAALRVVEAETKR